MYTYSLSVMYLLMPSGTRRLPNGLHRVKFQAG
jgi:hypothetical protein